jgi:excisionase family DNA binding protein
MLLRDREFTSEVAAALCGVTRVTVADWIARGRLEVRWTAGGHRRIPRASLAEFMARQGYALPRIVQSPRALVLLLDDEVEHRARLSAMLEQTGDFDVEALRPGVDALIAIGARCPDALLISARMPGFDAFQLVEAARRQASLAEMVVVMLTAHEEEGPAARRYGADAGIARDKIDEVAPLLARVLSERQRRGAPEPVSGLRASSPGRPAPERRPRRKGRSPRG